MATDDDNARYHTNTVGDSRLYDCFLQISGAFNHGPPLYRLGMGCLVLNSLANLQQ
jgi:hypothetical protein